MFNMSALQLAAAIKSKKIGVMEAVSAYIGRIEQSNNNTFLTVTKDMAYARAKEVQAAIDAGEFISELAGVPIALKDNISTAGIKTTCASKILENYMPIYNATVADKLNQAGMIVVGKLNMDEFAMGSTCETGAFGAVLNPWDTSRVAGGSSGGCAAAVAGGEVPLALGSDTGGSIRLPCAFCGVTGIKPTYGSVSRYGLLAYASSLDQIGPLGSDIDDCAALLAIISGPDDKDSTCIAEKPFTFPPDHPSPPDRLDGVRIGLPRNYLDAAVDEDVKSAIKSVAAEFSSAGAVVEEFDMPMTDYLIPAYYIIACAEASSNLSRYDGLKYGRRSQNAHSLSDVYIHSRSEGFGMEVKRRILLGSFVLSSGYYDAFYKKAMQVRSLIKDTYACLFKRFNIILSPVTPTTAYRAWGCLDDPLAIYMGDIFNVSVNLAGLPAVALPCVFDRHGMPVGCQLIGGAFCEDILVNASRVYQHRTAHHLHKPGGDAL